MEIDINKKYVTKSGREVELYAVRDEGMYPVHGIVKNGIYYLLKEWTTEGKIHANQYSLSDNDLVEVKPRIRLPKWMVIFPGGLTHTYHTKEMAESSTLKGKIDCEHGEGL